MNKLINQIVKLLEIKSIVTLAMTLTFVVLTMKAMPVDETFKSIFSVIIGFYFGTKFEQSLKKEDGIDERLQ